MENLRRRKQLIMVSNEQQAKFYCNKFNFNRFKIFKEDMVAVTMLKKSILWNKPTYLGAAILDVSKLQLYKFHYKKMLPIYGKKARVMYKDAHSLFYEIQTKDVYEDLMSLREDLDFSCYPKNHFLYNNKNKKVPLKTADELKGCIVTEVVFLKPKAYSVAYVDGGSQETKRSAKGVYKFVKSMLHHDKFKSTLFDGKIVREPMKNIVSEKHVISINEVNKIALSPFDSKRFYHDDGIKSLAFGHYKTEQTRTLCIESREEAFNKNVNYKHFHTKNFDEGFVLEGQKEDALQKIADEPGKDNEFNSDDSSSGGSVSSFNPPDPGLVATADISSDEGTIVDWNATIIEKPYPNCPYIDDEAAEDVDTPPRKRYEKDNFEDQ